MKVINDGKAWVKTQDAQYHLSVEHLRKLDPATAKLVRELCQKEES
jgi:hypothetical protein